MSDHDAITTPPRRRVEHHHQLLSTRPQHHHHHLHHQQQPHQPQQHKSSGGDSCKNTPNLSRKIDAYQQNALFDGGSQSAKSSPLPHRRLDKLEGCIRDKPSPLSLRKRLESLDDNNHSTGSCCSCGGVGDLEPPPRRNTTTTTTDCGRAAAKNSGCDIRSSLLVDSYRDSPLMRRRLDTDCGGCAKRPVIGPAMTMSSPQVSRRHAVMGEPGCFNSPIHHQRSRNSESTTGEPGVFPSPARSISSVVSSIGESDMCNEIDALADDLADGMTQPAPDQTVVSGWLKFRDNKRVRRTKLEMFSIPVT